MAKVEQVQLAVFLLCFSHPSQQSSQALKGITKFSVNVVSNSTKITPQSLKNHIFYWHPCDSNHTPLMSTASYLLMVVLSCLRCSFGSQESEMLTLKQKFICVMSSDLA